MDTKLKIIKLDNSIKENKYIKKNLYKDILSSSDKIKNLIKKTKRTNIFKKKDTPKIQKKTLCNKSTFIKYEKKEPPKIQKKTNKKIIESNSKSKKINQHYKPTTVLKYFNKSQSIKIFTQKEINKFINVLHYYSEYDQHTHIHKYIKKLNKYQTLQVLFDLKLIIKKSKAPIKLLKNILYNYFLSNIIITR
jgi:hypothetical protein